MEYMNDTKCRIRTKSIGAVCVCCLLLFITFALNGCGKAQDKEKEGGKDELAKGLSTYHFQENEEKQNVGQSEEWFYTAAEKGNADAAFLLGMIHMKRENGTQSSEKAAEWFKKAAEMGHVNAQMMLSFCYYNGLGVEESIEIGDKWAEKAISNISARK